ncbi:MAG: CBS domain-containing protein [Candidatus Syntropharchaeales archaeon]
MIEEIKVSEVMTQDVIYAKVPGSRDDVLKILKEKRVSGVPVVKDGKVVGIVTREDLLRNPEEEQIALLMTRNPITIAADATIVDAAESMLTYGIRRLPVVVDGELVGIITVADIVRVIGDFDIRDPIKPYLEKGVVCVWDETPLPVVGRIMELADAKAVPVLDRNEKLVGIVTDRDLINAAIIEESVVKSDMSSGSDEDEWTWEGMRDTLGIYYGVSKIKLPDTQVKNVMVKEIVSCSYYSGVSECARKMVKNRFDQLPVASSSGKLTGLLRDRDLLKAIT